MATITCRDCGSERHRTPKNTAYCKVCRLLRDVEFWLGRIRTCGWEHCDNEFAPIGRHDHHCGPCNLGQTANRGSCALCGHEAYRIEKDIAVCERCARAPEKRAAFIKGLRRRQNATIQHPDNQARLVALNAPTEES